MNFEVTKADEKPIDIGNIPSLPETGWSHMQEQAAPGAVQFPQPEELHPALPSIETGSKDESAHRGSASVPIPRANSNNQVPQATSPTGPMSGSVWIPPRPRPGRKPIPVEDAADRRRLQNRIAQRNFRDKRQQRLAETQSELFERKKMFEKEVGDMENQLQALRNGKKSAEQQNEKLKKHVRELERRNNNLEQRLRQVEIPGARGNAPSFSTTSSGSVSDPLAFHSQPRTYGPFTGGSSLDAITPPDEHFGEIDFTSYGTNNQNHQSVPNINNNLRTSFSNDSTQINFGMEMQSATEEDNCGFCTDSQNCLCKQESTRAEPALRAGNCAACMDDPARAAACQQLLTAGGFQSATAEDSHDSTSMPPPKVSCSQFMDQVGLSHQRLSSATEVLNEQHPRAYPGDPAGWRMKEQVAVQALRKLSQQDPPDMGMSRLLSDAKPPMSGL